MPTASKIWIGRNAEIRVRMDVITRVESGGPKFQRKSDGIDEEWRIYVRFPAARCARVVREFFAPKTEGVGNAGCPLHPQPRVVCRKHAR